MAMTRKAGGAGAASPTGLRTGPLTARNLGAMLLLTVVWGLSIPITKLGLEDLPPLTLTAFRFGAAVPLLLVVGAGRLRMPWRAVPSVAALGVLGITLGNAAQTFGVQGTSASAGTIISATIPVLIVIFAAIRLKQAVTGRQWFGLAAAFAGIALVAVGTGSAVDAASRTTLAGVGWMLLSAVTIAFYYVWSAELVERYGTLPVATWNIVAGFLAILPLAFWEASLSSFVITARAVGVAVYLGMAVTVLGLLLWLYLLRVVPARVAASVQYLQPVFGIAASAALFGDPLGVMFGVGVVMILGGLALTVANDRAARGRRAAPTR